MAPKRKITAPSRPGSTMSSPPVGEDTNRHALKKTLFHHPDVSWPILRRTATEVLLYTALDFALILATRGRSLLWAAPDPRLRSYRSAQRRLYRDGWLAWRQSDGGPPHLIAAPQVVTKYLPHYARPRDRWERRWHGTWWVLAYDVPESHRRYRRQLNHWGHSLGMGGLQDSLFVSPDDVRPQYRDLEVAAAVTEYAVLFESRTVLGWPEPEVSRRAWRMDRLERRQRAFIEATSQSLRRVEAEDFTADELRLLQEEAYCAYASVMENDPLLPRSLWPSGYAGEEAYGAHKQLQRTILQRLPLRRTWSRTH